MSVCHCYVLPSINKVVTYLHEERSKMVASLLLLTGDFCLKTGGINIDYFMVGERVRFSFTSCEESQTNERVFERVNLPFFTTSE